MDFISYLTLIKRKAFLHDFYVLGWFWWYCKIECLLSLEFRDHLRYTSNFTATSFFLRAYPQGSTLVCSLHLELCLIVWGICLEWSMCFSNKACPHIGGLYVEQFVSFKNLKVLIFGSIPSVGESFDMYRIVRFFLEKNNLIYSICRWVLGFRFKLYNKIFF